jgi:hypothetical protein
MGLSTLKSKFILLLAVVILSGCSSPDIYNSTETSQYTPEELNELQAETVERVIAIALQVEKYIEKNPSIGAPKADDIHHLIIMLADAGLTVEGLETEDAFGNTLVYRHHFSEHPMNRKDYELISLGEDNVQELWKITDHIRDTLYGQDIVWRHQSAVNDRSGFTHGPSLIRSQYKEYIAPPPGEVKLEY